ncbi:MAG: uracil-DNA glycosylase [Candidatus Taylorbacteria bacterium]|nr:uracil-DNA glycosylase [Candidatus Taylorbacteria bacterium]
MEDALTQVNKALKKKFSTKKLIFGQGFDGAKVVFVVDPPTHKDEAENKPITGHSEKALNKLLRLAGLNKQRVYITNVIKYTVSDRVHTAKEIKASVPFLKEEIKTIQPAVVVTLGNTALNGIGLRQPLVNVRGKTFNFGSYELLATHHPESLLKNPGLQPEIEADFLKLKELLKNIKDRPVEV